MNCKDKEIGLIGAFTIFYYNPKQNLSSCQRHISVCTIQGCLIHSAVSCIKSTNYSNSGQSEIAAGNSKQACIFHASF